MAAATSPATPAAETGIGPPAPRDATTPLARQAPDPNRIRIDFLPAELRKPRRDGIELFKIGYWHDALPALAARDTARLPVRYDPRDLSRVWLRVPGGSEYLELR